MKRNNSLMIAYIIFVFISATVRFFGEYPMWRTLVAAITTTSWMISLADFYYATAIELRISSKEDLRYAEAAILDIQGMLDAIEKILVKNENRINSTQTSQENMAHYVDMKNGGLHFLEKHQKIRSMAEKDKNRSDIDEKIAAFFAVAGFIAFFMILAFEQISTMFIDQQDIMTVMAFGIILLTQYTDAYSKEKRKRTQESHDILIGGWEVLRKGYESEVLHYAD